MPNVLMVTSQDILTTQNDGGKQVSYRNYCLLRDVFGEDNVQLMMCFNRNIGDKIRNILSGRLFASHEAEVRILEIIKEQSIDIVFLDRSLYGSLIRKIRENSSEISKCHIWVFVHNLEKEYFKNKLRRFLFISNIVNRKVEISERQTISMADCIIGLTQRDAEKIRAEYHKEMRLVLPVSFADRYNPGCEKNVKKNGQENERDGSVTQLLFIGSNFEPNYDGIRWFVANVMPCLKDTTLRIVGKNFEKGKGFLERDNVKVIGTVDDLGSYYYGNDIVVMPIFYGDGQKVKTAEAMMYGKIILGTDEAFEGYEIKEGNGFFRCNTKEEFVDAVRKVQTADDETLKEWKNSVRKVFLEKYEYENSLEKFRKLAEEL